MPIPRKDHSLDTRKAETIKAVQVRILAGDPQHAFPHGNRIGYRRNIPDDA